MTIPASDWGITAKLTVRRKVVERVGKFDPMLGAGGPLRSGGEPDFLLRVLRARYNIVSEDSQRPRGRGG